jgi:exodeoxyribonuclease VII large subunit
VQIPFLWEPQRRVWTVSALTEQIREALAEFDNLWISGEISGVKAASSGHIYFTLKDEGAQIRCACFARTARFLRFKPRNGVEVLVRGRIDVFAPRGDYQLLVDAIEPRGHGALQQAFEDLKKRLATEGLFDASRKRPIPIYPQRIGIVTSPTGAVIQDMVKILKRRFPGIHIRLYPALVQGEGAAAQVVRGLEYFSKSGWPDVVIVARGGGSVEDLWTFNEEAVARAIAASAVPVISAIGHETDFTIADFVADLRAPTPSAAAELVSGTREQLVERIESLQRRLEQSMRYRLSNLQRRLHQLSTDRAEGTLHRTIGKQQQRVDELDSRMRDRLRAAVGAGKRALAQLDARLGRQDLRLRLADGRRRWETATARLDQRARWLLAQARHRLTPLDAQLQQLSPLRVLDRGYAIVQTSSGAVLKDAEDASQGEVLNVRLAKGRLSVEVKSAEVKDASQ